MIANIFRVNGLNIHLGYRVYSNITQKCIENGFFSFSELMASTIISTRLYPQKNKKNKKKIYNAICKVLNEMANENFDNFINNYYNHSYYEENAKENISAFLDGVATVYTHLQFIPGKNSNSVFPFGKKFSLCSKIGKNNYMETIIDTDDIECFFGSVDHFYIHFKSGIVIHFARGNIKTYAKITDLKEHIDTIPFPR